MADVVTNTPLELMQYVLTKYGNDSTVMRANSGEFVKWFIRTRIWFDTNICTCKKKNMSVSMIENEYKALVNMTTEEKEKAYRIVGDSVVLNFNGELLGRLP